MAQEKKGTQVQPAKPKKPSKIKKFFRELKQEYKATSWPNRRVLLSTTGVVCVLLVIMGAYFGVLDFAFSNLTKYLLKALGIG